MSNVDDDGEEEVEELEGDTGWSHDNDEVDGDVKDESAAYLEFLQEEAQKFVVDDGDEELEEASLLTSVLDNVEPYNVFKASFLKMREGQPQLYENLTKILSPDEQSTLQNVVTQADSISAQVAAVAAQSSAYMQASSDVHSQRTR